MKDLDEQAAQALGKLEVLVSSGAHQPGPVVRSALASICGAIARADRLGPPEPEEGEHVACS
jgi:hypothetical protein